MKRRNRKSRQQLNKRKPLSLLNLGKQRQRKTWTFEQLEERIVFSVQPYQMPVYQTVSYSNDTPEGAAQTYLDEMAWANYQAFQQQQSQLSSSTTVSTGVGAGSDASVGSSQQLATYSLPNDPLFGDQWHLLNTGQAVGSTDFPPIYGVAGQDVNVVPVWNQGYTGTGIKVAVIDTGVQITHPDLVGNIDPLLRYNAITGTTNVSPDLNDGVSGHGTSVAGLIGATWNNLGGPVLDADGNPVLDVNGNPVYQGGGTGVAPGVTLVPIKLIAAGENDDADVRAFRYALQNNVDITNNSWGPAVPRQAVPLTDAQLEVLRDSALFGRNGLGMINVFASGNSAGPSFSTGFSSIGDYDSASYDAWVNSRYTISVTGVNENGQYRNPDGSFTDYPEAGASVLVAAPTGSNAARDIGDDKGQGSGLWTTDLIGNQGFNAPAAANGSDDSDPLADPNYTSRFNGTSAAAPLVSGVIALMLQANPTLTYRDVQEILVRSARQNAPLEVPNSGGGLQALNSTWQTNQLGPFQNPDPYDGGQTPNIILQQFPVANPDASGDIGIGVLDSDIGRQFGSRYEPQPALFTNGAGYTVSQGYGVYNEQIGYAHGVVDADLAVTMAKQWDTLGQNIDPQTEKTFSTFVVQPGANIPAAERLPLTHGGLLIPGGIGGRPGGGFSAYWDQYYATNPFANYTGPGPESRGESYLKFSVPADQSMNIEWVEVRVDISGSSSDLNNLRIMLVSPDGTQSELNNFYIDDFGTYALQPISAPLSAPVGGSLDGDGGAFTWTFSTNRNWGESSNTAVIIDPVTGEPLISKAPNTPVGVPGQPVFRDWEVHIENWSGSAFTLNGIELVWHGKPIAGGALDPNWGVTKSQRIQGTVGIDTNGDEKFDYQRSVQTVGDLDGDPTSVQLTDVQRKLDFNDVNQNGIYEPQLGDTSNLEPFAANQIVQLFRVDPNTNIAETTPTAQFLTGADGNYYFDVDPTQTYEVRLVDQESLQNGLLERPKLDDFNTPNTYLQHYKSAWRITPDWFYAPDRDNPIGVTNNPGEIFVGTNDANGDGVMTQAPMPFLDAGKPIPMEVRNINFLLKQEAPPQHFDVTGTVYSDLNGNGIYDGNDALASNVYVYQDTNRNGVADAGEQRVLTDANGQYTLTIPADHVDTYAVGVIPPTSDWTFSDPGKDGVENVFAGPGSGVQTVNFFIVPPGAGNSGQTGPGTVQGFVFSDINGDGAQELGEVGVPNLRVFVDDNLNGIWDAGEQSVLTDAKGSFFLSNVPPGLHRIDIAIDNEGTPAALWKLTSVTGHSVSATSGFQDIDLQAGSSIQGISFGLDNLADYDYGDLPDSYGTTLASNGPRHLVVPGFHLGASVDGEVNGIPTPGATGEGLVGDDDDGVQIISNGGTLQKGVNTLRITVAGIGGLLTGWMDFNDNGHFDPGEKLDWSLNGTDLTDEADLNPGTYDLQITVPASAVDGPIASRFRWGEQGLSFNGPAQVGEVEDYYFGLNYIYGDYNRNGTVDQSDYNVWRATIGQTVTPFSGADGNGNGVIDQGDLDVWRAHFGQSLPAPGSGSALLAGEGNSAGGASSAVDPLSLVPSVESLGGAYSGAGAGGGNGIATFSSSSSSSAGASVGTPASDSSSDSSLAASAAGSDAVAFVSTTSSSAPTFQSTATLGQSAAVVSSPVTSNLLVLDQALSDINHVSYSTVDDSLYTSEHHDETHVGDLALAAVLNEDSQAWDEI